MMSTNTRHRFSSRNLMHPLPKFKWIVQLLTVLLVLKSGMGWAAQELVAAIYDVTFAVFNDLKFSDKLTGRRIAIYDFRDAETGEYCKPLTVALDEKVTTVVHQIKNFNDGKFTVVARSDLGAIENEYLISKGGTVVGYQGVVDLMEPSDILITGVWQNGETSFTVVYDSRKYPAIDTTFFPDTKSARYWSSTVGGYSTDYVWGIFFGNGDIANQHKLWLDYVRAVRDGR